VIWANGGLANIFSTVDLFTGLGVVVFPVLRAMGSGVGASGFDGRVGQTETIGQRMTFRLFCAKRQRLSSRRALRSPGPLR
jgi:hypothetical protein